MSRYTPVPIRCVVEFRDIEATEVQQWPDAWLDRKRAEKFGAMQQRLFGAVYELEQLCPVHGWEEMFGCWDCGWPMCVKDEADVCEECADKGPDCDCAGGCRKCVGVSATGAI